MQYYTIAVFPDRPEAPDSVYRQVFCNDEYPLTLRTRIEAEDEFEALTILGRNLSEGGRS
jgi:hypothetical protein